MTKTGKRREERIGAREAASRERRERLLRLASAAAFLAVVVVAVLVIVSQSGGGAGGDVEGVEEVREELGGIPQRDMVLGDPGAEVTLIEFGDLQCPACKAFAEGVLPEVIDSRVREGDAKLEFRNFAILGPDSVTAAAAALAAARQDRGWHYVELFYRNQGIEGSGYVDEEHLTGLAEAAGVPDMQRWERDRESEAILRRIRREAGQAERLGFGGTPSFAVEGPLAAGIEPLGTVGSAEELEAAIEVAGG